jgi:hypothetical protein
MTRYQTFVRYVRRWATTSDNRAASSKQRVVRHIRRCNRQHCEDHLVAFHFQAGGPAVLVEGSGP